MSPSRRHLLKTVALVSTQLAAGCTALSDGSPSTTRTSTSATDTLDTATRTPLPVSSYSFDWTAEVTARATSSHPPRVSLELTNTGDEAVEPAFGPTPPFSPTPNSARDATGLALYQRGIGYRAPERRLDGCWRLEADEMLVVYDILKTVPLAPGESVGGTYQLYNLPGNDACFPDGEYEFTDTAFLSVETDRPMRLAVTVTVQDGHVVDAMATGPVIRRDD